MSESEARSVGSMVAATTTRRETSQKNVELKFAFNREIKERCSIPAAPLWEGFEHYTHTILGPVDYVTNTCHKHPPTRQQSVVFIIPSLLSEAKKSNTLELTLAPLRNPAKHEPKGTRAPSIRVDLKRPGFRFNAVPRLKGRAFLMTRACAVLRIVGVP